MGLVDGVAIARQRAPPCPGIAAALAHHQRHRLERAELGKERVDLEGAHQTAAHALFGGKCGDVVLAEEDRALVGPHHAGDQVDEGGLAGAVGADECVAGARRQGERDVAGNDQ